MKLTKLVLPTSTLLSQSLMQLTFFHFPAQPTPSKTLGSTWYLIVYLITSTNKQESNASHIIFPLEIKQKSPSMGLILEEALRRASGILSLTRDQFQNAMRRRGSPPYEQLTIGAAIFRRYADSTLDRLLLVQRPGSESMYHDEFELPSVKISGTKWTLFANLAQQLFKKTGLRVLEQDQIIERLPVTSYEKEIFAQGLNRRVEKVTRQVTQLNYVVRVDDTSDMHLNSHEYCGYIWATENDIIDVHMTDTTRDLVREAWLWSKMHQNPIANFEELRV